MSSTHVYWICGLLPLVVPLPLSAALLAIRYAAPDHPIAHPLLPLSELLVGSLLFGGLPYVLLAGPVLWWARDRDPRFYRRLAWTAPLLFAIFAWKIASEALFPLSGAPIWEFVERAGSYAAPLALAWLMLRHRQPVRVLTLRRIP